MLSLNYSSQNLEVHVETRQFHSATFKQFTRESLPFFQLLLSSPIELEKVNEVSAEDERMPSIVSVFFGIFFLQ